MKKTDRLTDNWNLIKLDSPVDRLDAVMIDQLEQKTEQYIKIREMPAQVHDVLLQNHLISEEILVGWCKDVIWVGKSDWVYKCDFDYDVAAEKKSGRKYLKFQGIDTVADIFLNKTHIAYHDNFYLPETVEVTGLIQAKNTLLIHFHNTYDYIDKMEMPEAWDGYVQKYRLLRKPQHDFPVKQTHAVHTDEGSSYQGANPFHTPVGLYGNVVLEVVDRAEISEDWLRTTLSDDLSQGQISLELTVSGHLSEGSFGIKVFSPDGALVNEMRLPFQSMDNHLYKGIYECNLAAPQLWWPRGFGQQNLYRVDVTIYDGDTICDQSSKQFGFKNVFTSGNLDFLINNKIIRLWGGSMDPFQGLTHCWRDDRVMRMLDMVENAHMNILRLWGEGIPYEDRFYEECDRRGILVWQEFFMGYGFYPDSLEYRLHFRQEAEYLIKRIRHHISLLMWCGGNETRMSTEFEGMIGPHFIGEAMQIKDFPELLAQLDPGRYYHESSPSGTNGRFANDPLVGDYHTYDCVWQYPGSEYPNFISEDIRTAPPVMHSLKAFVRQENFWPENYSAKQTSRDKYPLPDSWMERVCISAAMHLKTGPIWEYYDADTPEEMIYRFGAAYGQVLRDNIERIRMGSREGGINNSQRSRGHLSCKLNDTWPKIYCAVIDYFQEGYIPYYATKQAQEPVLVCFDIRTEQINLWLVNDSAEAIKGTVYFGLFNPALNSFIQEKSQAIEMPQGCSDIVFNLDFLRFFRKSNLLYARFENEAGETINYAIDFVDVERHQIFPEAKLSVEVVGHELLIRTDSFARCIEISGDDQGDAFGWMFEDNYFDLLPGDVRKVRVLGRHKSGVIRLKPHYSSHILEINYQGNDSTNQ